MFCHLHYFQQQVAGINCIKVFYVCVWEREREHVSRPHVKKPWLTTCNGHPSNDAERKKDLPPSANTATIWPILKKYLPTVRGRADTGQQLSPMISHYTKPNQPGNIFSRTISWRGCYTFPHLAHCLPTCIYCKHRKDTKWFTSSFTISVIFSLSSK